MRFRTVAQAVVSNTYPHREPKDDFELFVLCGWTGEGIKQTEEEIEELLEVHRQMLLPAARGIGCSLVEYAQRELDQWIEPSGVS